jgi:hypothetical protein
VVDECCVKNCELGPARTLQHMLFKHLSQETNKTYGDLILYTEVCWLSERTCYLGSKRIFQKLWILLRLESIRLHN